MNQQEGEQERIPRVGYYAYAGYRGLHNLTGSNPYLYLRYAGEEVCEPGHFFDALRKEYHLHIILKGRGVFRVEGKAQRLGPGDIFVVPQGKENHYQADTADPWHYVWVAFSGSKAFAYLQQAGFAADVYTRKAGAPTEEYARLVREILDTPNLTHAHELRRMGGLYAILSLLVQSAETWQEGGSPAGHVGRALRYIQCHYHTATVADVAAHVGVSRCYLFTLFKQQLKLSPQQYLIQYRMETAADLLKTTKRRVGDIAAAVGYEDPLSFSKVFHHYYGLSPREYRRNSLAE